MNPTKIITVDRIHMALRYDDDLGLWEKWVRIDGELFCEKFATREEAVEWNGD